MKYFSCLAVLLAFVFNVRAQTNMYVWSDGEKITYPILMVDSITFGEEPTPDPNASLISVTDGTFSDWDKLPAEYVVTTTCHTQSRWTALKSLTVYADNNYINLLVEYDPSQITNTDNVPFHIYLNADYSAATGGFGDQWQDADTEIMLEGSIISGGKHHSYNPTIFQWAGTVGGKGWTWANIPAGHDTIGQSQMVGNKFEIQLYREHIPANWNKDQFTIGVDIQQNWSSVGVLPNGSSLANKLPVTIHQKGTPTLPETPSTNKEVTYTPSYEVFANPERGFLIQTYYTSSDLSSTLSANTVRNNRLNENITLYLHSYYLTDYMESDINQAFLDRMERNFQALREGGGKVVLRYSYKYDDSESAKPWDASPYWVGRHIDQLAPYWEAYGDVILCLQAGFIGVWGEWYYTSNFTFDPKTDEDFEPRWEVVNHLLEALPEDRQLALRTPAFKMRYLDMQGESVTPLTANEAYKTTAKARLCGHNDCFVASSTDYGTYLSEEDRTFWAEDTRYTLMGGETCAECELSNGANAIKEMEKFHWTYINEGYHSGVLDSWETDGSMTEIKRRLGYRFVLEKATFSIQEEKTCEVTLKLSNQGFAALANPRDVELILVNKNNPTLKYVYPQQVDPRFWMPGVSTEVQLTAALDGLQKGTYEVYLNLPDPYSTLHDNPLFSIRLANTNMWNENTGYNYLTDITL